MNFATANGIRIAYGRRGDGMPLVLLHGYPLDHTIWDDVAPLLAGSFDLILPDLRGFGQSEAVDAVYAMADMAADVAALLDYLKVEKAVIAGHSMGGYVALAFTRAYPQRALGLGLVSSQALADTPERKEGRYATAAQIAEKGVAVVAEAMPAKLSPDAGVQVRVRDLIEKQNPAGLIGALKAMAERPDSTPLLSGFKLPLVGVHGLADELIPVERAREAKVLVPHARLVELPGVGHMPMMEVPEEVAEALKLLL